LRCDPGKATLIIRERRSERLRSSNIFWQEETVFETAFYFDVQATQRPCTSKQEKAPFFGRER